MTCLYELVINNQRKLLPLPQAGAAYDNGWVEVHFGSIVYEDGETRPMTDDDRQTIARAADAYSESK